MNWFPVIVSALLSGLIGVLISNWYFRKLEVRRIKIGVLKQLLGNRNEIVGQPFTEALNQVFIVFNDDSEVLSALKFFHEVTLNPHRTTDMSNQKILDLFKAMCRHLGIKIEPLTDNFFIQPFNIRN